jgi:hypothetical protein
VDTARLDNGRYCYEVFIYSKPRVFLSVFMCLLLLGFMHLSISNENRNGQFFVIFFGIAVCAVLLLLSLRYPRRLQIDLEGVGLGRVYAGPLKSISDRYKITTWWRHEKELRIRWGDIKRLQVTGRWFIIELGRGGLFVFSLDGFEHDDASIIKIIKLLDKGELLADSSIAD